MKFLSAAKNKGNFNAHVEDDSEILNGLESYKNLCLLSCEFHNKPQAHKQEPGFLSKASDNQELNET